MVWNYQNADCSFKKNKFIVLFIIIFGILSFPISARDRNSLVPRKELKQETAEHKKFLNIRGPQKTVVIIVNILAAYYA